MQDAKFSLEQAWSAQLIFFDGLMRLQGNRIKPDTVLPGDFSSLADNVCLSDVSIGAFFALVNMDRECFDEWCICYQETYKKSSDNALLSSEEALSLMIEFISYFRCRLGFKISLLLDLVRGMKDHPSESIKPLTLWNQALQRVSNGELWIRGDSVSLLTFAGDLQVPQFQACCAAETLLECMVAEYCSASDEVKKRLQSLLMAFRDPAAPDDWQRCFTELCGKTFYRQGMLSSEEVFSTSLSFVAMNCYRFGFLGFEMIELMNLMRSMPLLYEEKWRSWRDAFQKFLE
jgi:hypothetical protein